MKKNNRGKFSKYKILGIHNTVSAFSSSGYIFSKVLLFFLNQASNHSHYEKLFPFHGRIFNAGLIKINLFSNKISGNDILNIYQILIFFFKSLDSDRNKLQHRGEHGQGPSNPDSLILFPGLPRRVRSRVIVMRMTLFHWWSMKTFQLRIDWFTRSNFSQCWSAFAVCSNFSTPKWINSKMTPTQRASSIGLVLLPLQWMARFERLFTTYRWQEIKPAYP